MTQGGAVWRGADVCADTQEIRILREEGSASVMWNGLAKERIRPSPGNGLFRVPRTGRIHPECLVSLFSLFWSSPRYFQCASSVSRADVTLGSVRRCKTYHMWCFTSIPCSSWTKCQLSCWAVSAAGTGRSLALPAHSQLIQGALCWLARSTVHTQCPWLMMPFSWCAVLRLIPSLRWTEGCPGFFVEMDMTFIILSHEESSTSLVAQARDNVKLILAIGQGWHCFSSNPSVGINYV